jgi:hypothetical protein
MRISLIHNQASGRRVALPSLRALIEGEGHELVRVIEHSADASRVADPPAELVVAAGGDGTVADGQCASRPARRAAGVLPLGTANNIAFSLGCRRTDRDGGASWHTRTARPFDIGRAAGTPARAASSRAWAAAWSEACMTSLARRPMRAGEPPPWQLVRALRRYAQTLRACGPRVDRCARRREPRRRVPAGRGLNSRSVGPNLEFAPHAKPVRRPAHGGDRPGGRSRALARTSPTGLRARRPVWRFRPANTLRRSIEPDALHVDDESRTSRPDRWCRSGSHAAAVTVLVPPPA